MNCPQCGAPLPNGAIRCDYCGEALSAPQPQQQMYQQPQQQMYQQPQQQMYQQPQQMYGQQPGQPPYQQMYQQPGQQVYVAQQQGGINPNWPIKSKSVAGILGIFLGGFGIHKFYLGQVGMGIIYLLFCWTGIPAVVGFIEGIIYLCSNDYNFQLKYHCRLQ